MTKQHMRVAFIHPDLGIGGAERLVVDAALGLQDLGHSVDIYTSHWNPEHCFEETRDGRLKVHYIKPPFPRSFMGKLHVLCAHVRQLHLISHLLAPGAPTYDVYFVDQLSTCVPFLRAFGKTRVVFYCHFPDKLLANGAFIDGKLVRKQGSILKRIYRFPMDWLEEITTRQADVILANSRFTARVSKSYFPSISQNMEVVYPGINTSAYSCEVDMKQPDIISITSKRATLLSLNRFEKKKNAALAVQAFAMLKERRFSSVEDLRLVLAGGYDPRLQDNIQTLSSLIELVKSHSLSYAIIKPTISSVPIPQHESASDPDVLFLLNFTSAQRTALLNDWSTKVLLYTPTNEHFGIGPVEGMACGVPVLACNSGGPTESVIEEPNESRTGWLRPPDPTIWANTLEEILCLPPDQKVALASRGRARVQSVFSLTAMSEGIERALLQSVTRGRVNSSMPQVVALLLGFIIAFVFARHTTLSPVD